MAAEWRVVGKPGVVAEWRTEGSGLVLGSRATLDLAWISVSLDGIYWRVALSDARGHLNPTHWLTAQAAMEQAMLECCQALARGAWLVWHDDTPAWASRALVEAPAPEARSRSGIYVASRASIPERSAMWREYRDRGFPIISTWIDEAGSGQTKDRGELLDRCLREAASCAAFVLYVGAGDLPLKIAFAEWGAAMAGGAVAFVVGEGSGERWLADVLASHPRTTQAVSVEEAMRLAYDVSQGW